MLFPTVTFALFFAVVYVVHLTLRTRPRLWKLAMVGASYVFYGWWDWRFCGLLGTSTLANWAFGHAIPNFDGARRRALVGAAVLVNLAGLSLFKYYGFFVETMSASFGSSVSLPVLELVLPIGISFFTFQAISYVIDVHRAKIERRPLLDFAVYLSFFPQLVAGPIVRATELLPQLDRLGANEDVEFSEAGWLVARGLFKKVVVASYLAEHVVDPVFAAPSLASRTELLMAFYGYAVQIYADFSGYTDIAIGIALLLGFRFPTNFDNPYRSRSIQEFWRRWHMTLSRWLRDYLYIPLGGNRGSALATYRNLIATMVLGGLWHGAAWTFVAWGTIHGLALSIERLASRPSRRAATSATSVTAAATGTGGKVAGTTPGREPAASAIAASAAASATAPAGATTEPEPDTADASETGAGAGSASETETRAGAASESGARAGAASETETGAGAGAASETETGAGAGSASETETRAGAASETETGAGAGAASETETGAGAGAETEPHTGAGSRVRPLVVVRWLMTFHVVCVAWILFRAETFTLARDFLVGLVTAPLAGPVNTVAVTLIVASIAAQLAPDELVARSRRIYAQLDPAMQSAVVGVWIFLISALGPQGVAPFIYFQF